MTLLNIARHRESGFTLIELMVAMTIGMIVIMAATELFLDAVGVANTLERQATLNRQAREMYDILSLGGHRIGINVTNSNASVVDPLGNYDADVNYHYIFGLRGRFWQTSTGRMGWSFQTSLMEVSASGALLYKLALYPTNKTPTQITIPSYVIIDSDQITETTFNCNAQYDPLIECASDSTTPTMYGYFRSDSSAPPSGPHAVQSVVFDLFDPVYYSPAQLVNEAEEDRRTVYWTAYASEIDRTPP